MTRGSPSRDDGFTLVEVLVSMFVFSLISVGALIALSNTLDARDAAETRLNEIEQLAATRRLMADDFAAAIYRKNRDGLGGFIESSQKPVETDKLTLTRRGRLNPDGTFPRGDLLRVSWRVEDARLIRSFLPHENPAYIEPPIDRVILEGVTEMKIRVIMPDVLRDAVQQTGAGGVNLPPFTNGISAIEVMLAHANGTTTHHIFEVPSG